MDVDKKPLEGAEVEAVTPCAAEEFSGEVVPTAVCAETKVHLCPDLARLVLGFRWRQPCTESGAWRILSAWPGAFVHCLRTFMTTLHATGSTALCQCRDSGVSRCSHEVVGSRRGGVVAALHGEQDVPTSHARDLVRHGLGRSAFQLVDTAFSARPWLVPQAAQSRQVGLAFACGAGRTQRQPDAEGLLVPGNVQHSAVSHRQHR